MVVMKLIAMTTSREGCGVIVAQRITFCRPEDRMLCMCIQGRLSDFGGRVETGDILPVEVT